jgi:hypothetical protein
MSINKIKLSRADQHPSFFQDPNINAMNNIKNDRTLLSVTTHREKRLNISDLYKLESPGSFNFTKKNDNNLNVNSAKHLPNGETLLSFLFFSKQNIINIQNNLKYLIFKELDQIIDYQDNNVLIIIMRSIYLEYSRHPKILDPTMSPNIKKILLKQYSDEVARLNDLVISETVPNIISQLQQYVDYLYDASKLQIPIDKPISTSVAGTRNLRSITNVLIGSNL